MIGDPDLSICSLNDIRIVTCGGCGGDKGGLDYAGRWIKCTTCNGCGAIEVEFEPVTMEDLE